MANTVYTGGGTGDVAQKGIIGPIGQGSENVVITIVVKDLTDTILDISGYSIAASRFDTDDGSVYDVDGTLTVSDGTNGIFTWTVSSSDTGIASPFLLVFTLTKASNPTYITLPVEWIVEDNPDISGTATAITVTLTAAEAAWLSAVKTAIEAGTEDNVVTIDDAGKLKDSGVNLTYDATAGQNRMDDGLILGDTGDGTHTIAGVALQSNLEIHSEGGTDPGGVSVHRHADSQILGAHILALKSRGTHASPTIVANNDIVMWLAGAGYDGTDYEMPGAIRFEIDGIPGNNDMPGRIVFLVTPNGGNTLAEAMRISQDKSVLLSDNQLIRPVLKDYGETVNAIGSIGGGTQDINLELGNVVSGTVDTSTTTFTFSKPPASGTEGSFTLYLTNGGSQTVNWPASVDWAGGTAPTLTAAGVDILTFTTIDGGVTWMGFAAGLDMQ